MIGSNITIQVDVMLLVGLITGFLSCLILVNMLHRMFTPHTTLFGTQVEPASERGGCATPIIIVLVIALLTWLLLPYLQ